MEPLRRDGTLPIKIKKRKKKKNQKRKLLTAAEAQRKYKAAARPHTPCTAADLPSLQSLFSFPRKIRLFPGSVSYHVQAVFNHSKQTLSALSKYLNSK